MEVIDKRFFYHRPDTFKIYPLGDIHCGSVHCAENDIKRKVDEIRDDEFAYWIGMGDYADCILQNDKRFDIGGLAEWVEKSNIVESQREWARELFKPISHKCIGLLTGNHEETIHAQYQIDFTRNLCKDLNVPYAGYACFVNMTFSRSKLGYGGNGHSYILHCWHGAGAAQTEGSRVMRLMRLVNDIQADIYLMGHLHCITIYTPARLMYHRGRVKSTNLAAVITGSWLKGYTQPEEGQRLNPTYVEKQGYKPSRLGCPVIKIKPMDNVFMVET